MFGRTAVDMLPVVFDLHGDVDDFSPGEHDGIPFVDGLRWLDFKDNGIHEKIGQGMGIVL